VKPAPFDYLLAHSTEEAVDVLSRHRDEAKVLAGGQSLVPMLNMRLSRPGVIVDINGVRELDYLRESDGMLAVGALVRQRKLERWAARGAPLIAEALRWVGHLAIRNRGTVAGSIAHADPSSELPALLVCLDGVVVARSRNGERSVPAGELYVAPLTTTLGSDELVTEVRFALPRTAAGWGFAEVARRHGDFALVGAVAVLWLGADAKVAGARLAFFGASPTPARSHAAEGMLVGNAPTTSLVGEAARVAAAHLTPDGDLHATADYRRQVAAVLAQRTLMAALERCGRAA